jgi:NADH-quinone oxidoreductase subunit N
MYLTSQTLNRLQSSLGVDTIIFLPEILVCVGIVLLLFLRLFGFYDRRHMGSIALLFVLLALFVSYLTWPGNLFVANREAMNASLRKMGSVGDSLTAFVDLLSLFSSPEDLNTTSRSQDFFGGLLVYDNFTVFLRMFLFGAATLMVWMSMLTKIPDREDSADFYVLLLGATVGMSVMASANHLLMVFIGVEMASLPSYALAGFLKGKRQSSEAALKYVVYGGGAAGIMLYGISLVAGKFGTGYLPDVTIGLLTILKQAPAQGLDPVLVLGTVFIFVGFGFKLAAVPFHFWCPDVFEGAAAEVAAFLSVASKGAALALFGRFAFMLAGMARGMPITVDYATWLEVAKVLGPAIAFIAAVTATFGNLAAYAQTNLKRLLAYSTIAHAGYMMMGLAPLSREGLSAVLFYLVAYLFMNLGAFAIIAFLRNLTGTEDLSGYRGMVLRAPLLTVLLAICLLSLLGMPPLAGFAAKFQIFSVLFNAGKNYSDAAPGFGYTMYALLVIGGLNTAISAMYYIKVLRVMCLERSAEQIEGEPVEPLPVPTGSAIFATVMAVMLFILGVAWNPLADASDVGANRFNNAPRPADPAKTASKV